jgi:hypothetical protein
MQLNHLRGGLDLQIYLAAFAVVTAVFLAAPIGATAAVASTAPAWRITAVSAPTNFVAGDAGNADVGPLYSFEATNVAGGPTSAPVRVDAVFPPGITPTEAIGMISGVGSPSLDCSTSGQSVACTSPGPVQPGASMRVKVVVDTAPGLSGSPLAEATVSGGGAAPATAAVQTAIDPQPPLFGFLPGDSGFASAVTAADGSPAALAGLHPYQLTVNVGFPSRKAGTKLLNSGPPRDVVVDLPQGLIVNPTAVPVRCGEADLLASRCPPASQVGIVTITTDVIGFQSDSRPLYNMVPPPGSASNFGFNAGDTGIGIHLLGSLRGGDYGLSAAVDDVPAVEPILAMRMQLWGDPSSPSHDAVRGASVPPLSRALLSLPSACGPLRTAIRADSWDKPGVFVEREAENQDLEGNPVAVSGCGELGFSPTLEARPTTNAADSPSGLDVGLEVPQAEGTASRATANLKQAQVTLPEGLVANPSGVNGLAACSAAQIGLTTPVGSGAARFDDEPATCPAASRIGALEVDTPVLDHPVQGSIFLATPGDNPFGSMLALYLSAEDHASGIVLKLAGEIGVDPSSGRLTASFEELPQLPIAALGLRFFGGAVGPLRTPTACGDYATTSVLTPWSAPESGPPATAIDSYAIDRAPASSSCARSEGALPSSPSFEAGTVSPRAGAYSPFVLDLKRPDGTQQLSSLDLTLPPGLVGRLAGVPYCPDAALAAARAGAGSAEQAKPSCPTASRLGSASVGAGAGASPYYVHGSAYLAGPYRGAPLSLAIVAPALAGPFDLGTVVVRSAIHVDPETAQVVAASDPFPSILRGIPLDLRSLRVSLDRPGFVRNPTSCNPTSVGALATSTAGTGTALSSRFQVGECRRLGFKPRVSLRLFGPTHRGAHPRFRTVLTPRPGDAAVRSVSIALPGTELLDSRRLGAICSRDQFAAGRCPADSVYGYAKVWTPLLDGPLQGPVYLRASAGRLPDLAASLSGQVALALAGRINSVHGRLRTAFRALPDAPLSKVVLTLRGGRRGLLVNTGGLCSRQHRASAELVGQNGKVDDAGPVVKASCR